MNEIKLDKAYIMYSQILRVIVTMLQSLSLSLSSSLIRVLRFVVEMSE